MKFKIDENLPIEFVELLQAAGYDASSVVDQKLAGKPDQQIIEVCCEEDRVLVTLDLDFADIYTYPPEQFPGIMVLRVSRQDKVYLISVFEQAIKLMSREAVFNRLWIIEKGRIRIRE